MGKLANSMIKVQAKDMLQGVTTIQNGHATTNDVMVASHIAHVEVSRELGKTARTGFSTVKYVAKESWWSELHPVGKIAIIGIAFLGTYFILKLLVDKDNKVQVAGMQTTNGKQFEETKLGEVKALPVGTAQKIDWNALQHQALSNIASNSKEAIEFLINTARQVVEESK